MKLLLCSFLLCFTCVAQLPESDIWLFNLKEKGGKVKLNNPINITNRKGYDNQPTFSLDGKSILYVVIDSTKQADIYRYNIRKKTATNITWSDASEYSPTLLPNGLGFSCVVVEKDSTQHVELYEPNGIHPKICPLYGDSVGYHTWLNKDTLLYYKLTEPHSLRVLDLKTNKDVWICNQPTRAFKKIGNRSRFIYGIIDSLSIQFRIYNPALRESSLYATYSSLNEDFIWHPELGLIKSEGSQLIRYNEQTTAWEVLFEFSDFGIREITRFTFDHKNKQLVIVNNL